MASKFITNFVGGTSKSNWAKLGCGFTQNMYLETKDQNEHFFSRVLLPFPGQEHIADIEGTPRGMFTAIGGYNGETVYIVTGDSLKVIGEYGVKEVGKVGRGRIHFDEIRTADKNFLLVTDESSLFVVDMTVEPIGQKMMAVPLPRRVNDDGSFGNSIQPTCVCVAYSMINVVDKGTDRFYTSVTLPLKVEGGSIDYDVFAVDTAPRDYDGGERPYYRIGYYTYAETSADPIEALVTDGKNLWAIGRKSFDRFDYTGVAISRSVTAGIVWRSPRGNGGYYGTEDPDSVKVLGGSVYYVARNPNGGKSVVRVGSGIELVSTPEIDDSIEFVEGSVCFQWGQHPFYIIRMSEGTIAYDVREGVWVNLSTAGKTWDIVSTTQSGNDILLQYKGGYGRFTTSKWTDHAGRPIVRKRRGIITNPNYEEFTLDKVTVVTNSGQYRNTGKEYLATFRWTCDGMTWEDTGVEQLGRVGEYERELDVYDLGIGKVFGVEISCSEDIPFCVYGIGIDATICDL